jgi:hypothetical protein
MLRLATIALLAMTAGCSLAEQIASIPRQMTDFSKWESGGGEVNQPDETKAANPPLVVTRGYPTALGSASGRDDPSPQPQEVERVIPSADPVEVVRPQAHLSIYRLTAPAGSISGDAALWKRVDESALDVRTHDILDRNGVRAGLAPLAELAAMMARHSPQVEPATFITAGAKDIEISMKREVPYQIIYHFAPDGQMPIRSFDDSENLLCLEFSPAPRKAGDVRVGVCPMVRSLRKRLVATGPTGTQEVAMITQEKFFDLALLVDVPLDSFLILAPSRSSTVSRSSMSLGSAFFVNEDAAGEKETIVLLVPNVAAEIAPNRPQTVPQVTPNRPPSDPKPSPK